MTECTAYLWIVLVFNLNELQQVFSAHNIILIKNPFFFFNIQLNVCYQFVPWSSSSDINPPAAAAQFVLQDEIPSEQKHL